MQGWLFAVSFVLVAIFIFLVYSSSSFNFNKLFFSRSLGQLASMAGIKPSDFQALGKPQLSSTMAPHLDGAASLTSRDVQAETDAASLVRMLSALLEKPFCLFAEHKVVVYCVALDRNEKNVIIVFAAV